MKLTIQIILVFIFTTSLSLFAQVTQLWSSADPFTLVYDFGDIQLKYYCVKSNNSLDFYDSETFSMEYSLAVDPNNNYLIYPSYLIPDMNSNGHKEILIETFESNYSVKIYDLETGSIIYQWSETGTDFRAEGPYQSVNSTELRVNIYKVVNFNWTEPSVFSLGVSPNSVGDKSVSVKKFILNQNYPNPFNPNTTISYYLDEPGSVSIKIFDISGQLIKEINKEQSQSGEYEVRWDGTNDSGIRVSSGTYFYSLESNSFRTTKKMILLK